MPTWLIITLILVPLIGYAFFYAIVSVNERDDRP
jgi:hypothetical protein